MKIFAIFVEYSRETDMVDQFSVLGSTVGLYRISNEVRRNKFFALAALLLTSWRELSILSNFLFPFSIFKMMVYTLMMRNFGFENRVR